MLNGGQENKVRGGSLSFANHKYNQSASGIKRGSTAPSNVVGQAAMSGAGRGDKSLNFAIGGPMMETSNTMIPGGSRHQYNVSSDLSMN